MPRIVITGLGCITPIGDDPDHFWNNALQGESGVDRIETFDVSEHSRQRGAEIDDFQPAAILGEERADQTGRASALGAIAAEMAMDDADLSECDTDCLLAVGSTLGDVFTYERANDDWFSGGIGAMPAALVHRSDPTGFVQRIGRVLPGDLLQTSFISNACSSGNSAIIHACRQLASDNVRVAIAGGCDPISRVCLTGFARLGIVAPEKCRPFDKNRKGAIFGEGAGFVILETLASARRRGVEPYAEIEGYGMTCDASNITAPASEGRGLAAAMSRALKMAGRSGDSIDYVGAHGTGTRANDTAESRAIISALGDHGTEVPVSSIKPMVGHSMGAASTLHMIACIKALIEDKIPPTINFETPDPECPIDCVPNAMREKSVEATLCNSAAFGGNNASVLLTRSPKLGRPHEQ